MQTHRDKRLAHLDFKTTLKQGPKLDNRSVNMIEEMFALVRDYITTIERRYYQAHIRYDVGNS